MVKTYVESPNAQVRIGEINDQLREWLASVVAKDARRFAPRDTGYLKTHIVVSPDNRRITALGAGRPPNKEAPAYVEFGTRTHSIPNAFGWGLTVQHPGTHPQPYLRPAAYRRRPIPPWVVQARASMADR